jgi:hypothetical protein
MDISRLKDLAGIITEAAPSKGMSKDEKSKVAKEAKKGEDIGSKGKNFKKIEAKAAKRYGSEEAGKKVAAAVMWKKLAKEDVEYSDEEIEQIVETEGYEETNISQMQRTAGISPEPIIENIQEDADTFIVFESKSSLNIIGIYRNAEDAKQIMKKYKKAVTRGYKAD